jgi:hypothetical protein
MKRRNTKSSKKMNRIMIIAIVLLAAGIVLNATAFMIPTSANEFDMYLTIDNYTGITVDTEAIFFGTVTPGGQNTRNVIITNNANATTRIELQTNGELARLVSFSNNSFSLAPGENSSVAVTATVPVDMPYGNYTGKLKILYFNRIW